MNAVAPDSEAALREAIARQKEAWNEHDLDAIEVMHAPDILRPLSGPADTLWGAQTRIPANTTVPFELSD